MDTDANANNAVAWHDGAVTIGHYPIVKKKLYLVSATLGDANTADYYITVLK